MTNFTQMQIRTARIRTSIGFILYGLVQGLWLVQIPTVVTRLNIDSKTLGLVVLTAGLASAIAQPVAGWFVGVLGSRRTTQIVQPTYFIIVPALILAPNLTFLFVASFIMGLVAGPSNVSINTQAAEVENARGITTVPSFHGWFSVGSFASASVVALIIASGFHAGIGITAVIATAAILSIWSCSGMLPQVDVPDKKPKKTSLRLPTGAVLGVALIMVFSNLVEGGTTNFNALFLSEVKGANEVMVGAGFTFYSFAMAAMRFAGGSLIEKFGIRKILTLGGVMVIIGFAIAILATNIWLSAFGFLIVGLGAANSYPVLIGAASRIKGVKPSVGVASVATAGLFGILVGPVLVGFVADLFGLSMGLSVLAVSGLAMAIGANLYNWKTED
ncbi:MAG: MFS transporter [OCS116 cluster bacterium]|nr:MFS transporter [OCS116 cluster bacterium]